MEHVFRIEQRSTDFVPASGTVVFNDNIEWDNDKVIEVISTLAELYDCAFSEIKYENNPITMPNKQTPIQKAIQFCPEECTAMREYLQSLLAEERQMVEDAFKSAITLQGSDEWKQSEASDYFTQTYES